jgi:hypothetical protein
MMLSRARWLLMPALLLGWLGLAAPARAVFPPPIKDDAKLFSADAVDKANKKIKEIYAKSRKDLVIETYAGVPEGKKLPEDPKKKGEFFDEWAKSRLEELGVTGVYVLICKTPPTLRIRVDPTTYRRAFTQNDIDQLFKKIIAGLREKKFDDALKDAVDLVETRLRANAK